MTEDSFQKKYLKAEALALVRQSRESGNKSLLETAIEKYRQCLALNPQDDDAWSGLGGAYRTKGDIGQALDSYSKAFEINPQSTYALVNIVSLRTARDRKEDREKLKSEAPEAIRLCQQAIKKNTEDFWTWYDLAILQLIQGDVSEAIGTFNYALRLTPETAKENFRSVLSNLEFLREHNPSIAGISTVTEMINQHLS
jgi:tetratricopeptide (TPR) repeat protein